MKPLLIYDGDCGFCRFWIERFRERTQDRLDYAPSQEVGWRFPEIGAEAFARSVQFIEADGKVYEGAESVFRALALAPSGGRALWAYRHIPGVAPVTEWAYRLVAGHRQVFSRITRWLWGANPERPTYAIASCLFIRAMGLVYLIAFLSLAVQILGLVGSNGILPAHPFLEAIRARTGIERYWFLPTLCWIDASDTFLRFLCLGGAFLSVAVIGGLWPAPCLALLWAAYLSLAVVCRTFLNFQWDILLLEAGFLAIFLAPLRWRCRLPCPSPPPRAILWLLRWLLFRLMFSSGVVKLTSGDLTWRNLTALNFHYQTQPLPPWTAWYMQQLPARFQEISVVIMFIIELGAPLLIFAPRRLRLFGCGMLLFFQALIVATGNYAFFNLLSIALCLVLIDDGAWPERSRRAGPTAPPRRWPIWAAAPFVAVLVLTTSIEMIGGFRWALPWPSPVVRLVEVLSPLRIANSYGLFRVMTTTRPEIIVEGSRDGTNWLAYEFKWKPGDPMRRPLFVAPHQPRLDWQMWFAALSSYRSTPWFPAFLARLLQGSPEVLALLERNPFPGAPPRYVRASVYDYRFTDAATRRATGAWWTREPLGPYSPVQSLPRR